MTNKTPTKKISPKTDATKTAKPIDELTVSEIAQELGIDPKRARATLRKAGRSATDGRWPTYKRGSKAHADVVALLTEAPAIDAPKSPKAAT